MDITNWYSDITISNPGAINEYGQYSYTTSTIKGRLINIVKEVLDYKGTKVLAKGKLFTNELLEIDTKVENYRVISIKDCKDLKNNTCFYKYYLV